jgi:transcriptional regulator with XRE-family HTH domain
MAEEQEDKFSPNAEEKVGDYLRRVRETRGLELEQLAKSIRLGLNVLQAIEENNWSFFPTEAYLRSYIGSICEKLSIDKIVVIERLSLEINSRFRVAQINIISEQDGENGSSSSSISKIAIIIIIVIIAILFFVNKTQKNSSKEEPPVQAPRVIYEEPAEEDDESISDSLTLSEPDAMQANSTLSMSLSDPNKIDTLRFECTPAPQDDKCGIKLMEVNKAMNWFKNVSYLHVSRKDTARITVTVPWRTRLFVNGARVEYGNFNTLVLYGGQVVRKSNRDLR